MATTPEEEHMQNLRSRATELFIREEWNPSIEAYSQFITLCTHHLSLPQSHFTSLKLRKSLCIALCNRAEAKSRLREFNSALDDCDYALQVDGSHFKTLVCKGKILLSLNRYSMALHCFKMAHLDPQANGNVDFLGFWQKCRKFEFLSRTGFLDLSDWVSNGFLGKAPELAEYIGAIQIRKSEISGRGIFVTKDIDAGSLILITKAIAMERSMLTGKGLSEDIQLVMWKNFVDKVVELVRKCHKTRDLIEKLSIGGNEDELDVPDVDLFRPESIGEMNSRDEIDMVKLLAILDVNSLTEEAVSANVLRKNNDCYGVGLWLLPSFINHSCSPNVRRLHVGDYLIVHASRDLKADEELTIAYYDPLSPLNKRRDMSVTWGIQCRCKRCKFEVDVLYHKKELKEIEIGIEKGMDVGSLVYKLEEQMKRWKLRGKERGYMRASFWSLYSEAYGSEKCMKKWGRRIPILEAVVDSITDAVGSDHRVLKILNEELKKKGSGSSGDGNLEMEKVFRLGREVYGKVMKKHAMRKLLELCNAD
ncbi:hypothetical protein RYX36_035876 [Vicia faba]